MQKTSKNANSRKEGRTYTGGTDKVKIRSNFYLETDHVDALKKLAQAEQTSVSDLVREGIDRVISERMNNPKRERNELRANLRSFLERYASKGSGRSLEEIEDLVSDSERSRSPA